MKKEIVKYQKRLTLNDQGFYVINECIDRLLVFVEEKCAYDQEKLEYFQLSFTDSEKVPFAKDLIIKWAVTKNCVQHDEGV